MPDGHVELKNVLFAPLLIKKKVVGLLGLANKEGGFNKYDAHLATAFGELAAITLINSRTLELLEDNEERYRSLAQSASDSIISIDNKGKIFYWNKAAEEMFGYHNKEIVGKELSIIMPQRFVEDHQKGLQRLTKERTPRLIGRSVEMIGMRKDGFEFPIELSLSMWKSKGETFYTGIIRDITDRKEAEEALRHARDSLEIRVKERTSELSEANKLLLQEIAERKKIENILLINQRKLRSMSSQLSIAEEKERRRIASELHDSIGQTLAILKIKLEEANELAVNKRVANLIKETVKHIEQTIVDTRTLVFDLSSPVLYTLGLEAALEKLTEQVKERYQINTKFVDDQMTKPLDDDVNIILFQAVRELLINVVKHAQAKNVEVSIQKDGDSVLISVSDDGIGFDTSVIGSTWDKKEGFGLYSLRERLDNLDGYLEIQSEKGLGTKIRLMAPLKGKRLSRRQV